MSSFKFTIDNIAALDVPASGRKEHHDTECPGLTVIVTHAGTKTFYRYGRIEGKPERVRIGEFPQWSVASARRQCRVLTGQISQGINPQAVKRQQRQERSVGELWEWFTKNCGGVERRKNWKKEVGVWTRLLSRWASKKIKSIERADFVELHTESLTGGPHAGDRLLGLVRAMWNQAIANRWAIYDPTHAIEFSKKVSRKRYLKADEIPVFFLHLFNLSRRPRDYLLLKILTGARSANVLGMRFTDVVWDESVWEIPGGDSKSKSAMRIILPPLAMHILRLRFTDYGNQQWVFPSKSSTGHYTCAKTAWNKVKTLSGLKNIRPHDLRRTLGTWQRKQGTPLETIGDSLGHSSQESTKVYAIGEESAVRESVERAIDAIFKAEEKNSENFFKLHLIGVWCACGRRLDITQ